MDLSLPSSISSSQDLRSVRLDVQHYAKWFSQAAVKKRVGGSANDELPAISEVAAAVLKSWHSKQAPTSKTLDDLIAALTDFEASAPRLTITLAAPPPKSLKQSLTDWCRQNVNPSALVDFKFNSTILGGMVVTYGSHTFDWSFRRQILANRDKFPEILRHV